MKHTIKWHLFTLVFLLVCHTVNAQTSWRPVPPVDFSKIKPSDFSDDELDLPRYLASVHQVANSVVETGESRGFINIAVWRATQDNQPYNARIMESILSLAYFYATNRPWNQVDRFAVGLDHSIDRLWKQWSG